MQPGLVARDSDPPLPEDAARRAANHAAAEAAKAKKEREKLQRGRRRQGSEESDGDDEEEEDESDPNIPWGALALEDEQTDAGQANLTLIPQHAPAQTEEDALPRSARKDVPPRSEEQVHPAPTDPTRGAKRPVADVAESELSGQPSNRPRIMASR